MRALLTLVPVLLLACEQQASITVDGSDVNSDLASDVSQALRAFPVAEVEAMGSNGVPLHVRGALGRVPGVALTDAALSPLLSPIAPVFRLAPADLSLRSVKEGALGSRHLRFQQLKHGLEVVGGELIVHVDAQGQAYAMNGVTQDGMERSPEPTVTAQAAVERALADAAAAGGTGLSSTQLPSLVYLLTAGGALGLAWSVLVEGERGELPLRDRVFVDAARGAVLEVHPQIHTALRRQVYTSGNTTSTPGSLRRSEGGAPSGDPVVDTNYAQLGATHACYQQLFGRDSIDGAGLTLRSSVHYGRSYSNAFWNGTQMVYGDGDGVEFAPLALSLDITAHELTHGVTERESGLIYRNESGALNEALSDIFAAVCEWHARGKTLDAATWLIGEDVYTPRTSGDALRSMASPTTDGYSTDSYPERLRGSADNGGVHGNSGIANLAFKLLVTGGTHPRGRTNVAVPALGMEQAAAIFYRAQTQYLTSNATFQAARAATAQAALDLFGPAAQSAVHAAWSAVAVPGAPAGSGAPPPASSTVLRSGVAVTALSGAAGAERRFTVEVPAGATTLRVAMSGGTGDADLYVRFGAPPTTATYDARPYLTGNAEAVAGAARAGTYHVLVRGFTAFSGVQLVATY